MVALHPNGLVYKVYLTTRQLFNSLYVRQMEGIRVKLPLFRDKSKTLGPALYIVSFIIIMMLNLGFSIVAVILVINGAPFSLTILIVSQILLWFFAYGGLHWLNKTYFSSNEDKTDNANVHPH